VDDVDTRAARPARRGPGLWTTHCTTGASLQTARMSIEMPAAEVHALADELRDRAGEAEEAQLRLAGPAHVGGPLQPAVEAFLLSHRTAGQALAGELRALEATITSVADSWLALDGALLARMSRPGAE
jgi:hypothetical protein